MTGPGGPARYRDRPIGELTEAAGWHRLHPLSPLVRAGRHLATIGILIVVLVTANRSNETGDLISNLVVIGVALAAGVVSWLVTRWQVAGGVLRIETGLIRRQSRRFPLSQVQAIDVVQTGIGRLLGLSELRLRMAGGDAAGGRLASLPRGEAERLREQLLSLGRASAGPQAEPASQASAAVAAPSPQRELFRVRSSRLAIAIIFSAAGAWAAVVVGAAIAVVAITGRVATIASFLPFVVGVLVALWRRFNSDFGTVVAVVPDGLRLRSGLVQTAEETIRPGRVQAVRLAEPLIWRRLGWCRLEVDVAGAQQRRENRSESKRLRALIPVGSRAEARKLIAELLASQPGPTVPAPRGAVWKAPLSYHFLAWGGDDRYVVARRGRLGRTTTWVPLEKVQSVRWVQGPVQRRLGLASVRLDVAGRRVAARIQDRSVPEAREIFGRLPGLASAARHREQALTGR